MDVEQLAWELLRRVIEEYDDKGIVLHGRVFNQGDNIKLDFVSAVDLTHFGQFIPKNLLTCGLDVEQWAELFCELRVPEYYANVARVKPHSINSTYRETFQDEP